MNARPKPTKDTRLSVRVETRLKMRLEDVARREGRSVAQVAEVLLNVGLEEYGKKGSALVQQWIAKRS